MAYEMPAYIRRKFQGLLPEFLRTALAEKPLTGVISLENGSGRMEFRNCHQTYVRWQLVNYLS